MEEEEINPEASEELKEEISTVFSTEDSNISGQIPDTSSIIGEDFRREWVKNRILNYLGVDDDIYFEEMLAENDGYLEQQLTMLLNVNDENLDEKFENKIFYVNRTWSDRLFQEEIYVKELGM